MTTQTDNKKFFDRVERSLKQLVEHFTRPALPRTISAFVFDAADGDTLKFINTLEGSMVKLKGIGTAQIVRLLQFQAIGGKSTFIQVFVLVEYKVVTEEVEDDVVLAADQGDSSISGTGEVAAD
jgi:hypothetical protein